MKHNKKTLIALAGLTLGLTACARYAPVYNVHEDPAPAASPAHLSESQVKDVIISAAAREHWKVSEVRPGLLHGSMDWQHHGFVADIAYTRTSYSIHLVSSYNLGQSDGQIHYKYNLYVHRLQNEIDRELAMAAHH